jgi:hypothetical protein
LAQKHHTYRVMSAFLLTEEKALLFHRALVGVAREHPNLIARARAEVDRLREKQPSHGALWDRWTALLDMAFDDMIAMVLADTPDGGLLRAHSPLGGALSAAERNVMWQRIGLVQFIDHFFIAVDDLALSVAEQAGLTGHAVDALTAWRTTPPETLKKGDLDKFKQVVSLFNTLKSIAPDQNIRRRWLRVESETLGGTPIDLLLADDADRVMGHLVGAAQLTLGPDDLPRM